MFGGRLQGLKAITRGRVRISRGWRSPADPTRKGLYGHLLMCVGPGREERGLLWFVPRIRKDLSGRRVGYKYQKPVEGGEPECHRNQCQQGS